MSGKVNEPPLHRSTSLHDVVEELKSTQSFDYLSLADNHQLNQYFQKGSLQKSSPSSTSSVQRESVLFSNNVIKINKRGKQQKRILILTSTALYNFKSKDFATPKRRIAYSSLKGIILSRKSEEIVFQVQNEYDYHYILDKRVECLQVLEQIFNNVENAHLNLSQIAIQVVDRARLSTYVMTKDQLRKAASKSNSNSEEKEPDSDSSPKSYTRIHLSTTQPVVHITPNDEANQNADSSPENSTFFSFSSSFHSNSASQISAIMKLQNTARGALPTKGREGWVMKRKGRADRWDRKYIQLSGTSLSYYVPRLKGYVSLEGARILTHDTENEDSSSSKKGKHESKHKDRTLSSKLEESTMSTSLHHESASALAQLTTEYTNFSTLPPAMMASVSKSSTLRHAPRPRRNYLSYQFSVCTDPHKGKKELQLAAASTENLEHWISAFRGTENQRVEGWLMKRDPSSKAWRPRYFTILNNNSWYFEMSLKGVVDLSTGSSAYVCDIEPAEDQSCAKQFVGKESESKFSYRWNVSDSSRIFHFASDCEADRRNWIDVIEARNVAIESYSTGTLRHQRSHSLSGSLMDIADEHSTSAQPAPNGPTVCIVFTDVQGSTQLWETVPEIMDDALELHDKIVRAVIKNWRGYEVKTVGDSFMVAFFNACDAVSASLEIQERLVEAHWNEGLNDKPATKKERNPVDGTVIFHGIRVRIGIHTGPCNVRFNPITSRADYFGSTVNRAARISDAGNGGQIVCSDEVIDLIKDHYSKDPVKLETHFSTCEHRANEELPELQHLGNFLLKGVNECLSIHQINSRTLSERTFGSLRAQKST